MAQSIASSFAFVSLAQILPSSWRQSLGPFVYLLIKGTLTLAALAVLLYSVFKFVRRTAIRISPDGLDARGIGLPLLAWEDIEEISYLREPNRFVLLIKRTADVRETEPARGSQRLATKLGAADLAAVLPELEDPQRRIVEVMKLALTMSQRNRGSSSASGERP
ncbi:MAG: hypothetical protein AB8H80_02880 [Planctomycetota bacterium]